MIWLGIDLGCIGLKVAALADPSGRKLLEAVRASHPDLIPHQAESHRGTVFAFRYERIKGDPIGATDRMMKEILAWIPPEEIHTVVATGSAGRLLAEILRIPYENEFKAIAKGIHSVYPDVKTILSLGGESSKYIRLAAMSGEDEIGIEDYERNGDCAAGTGSFIDQQATRLRYGIDEVGQVVLGAERAARIAGRCSVFAKSDMVHAQQKGMGPPEILRGLCEAVAGNFKGTITKGKPVVPPVAFVGGVAANAGVVEAMRKAFDLGPEELKVPELHAWIEATGAALLAAQSGARRPEDLLGPLRNQGAAERQELSRTDPLSMEKVILLRDRVKPFRFDGRDLPVDAYLGIDVGSVSTNLAVIDGEGEVIHAIYLRTDGRPIEVVSRGLREIEETLGDRIRVCGVATTGSGRELIGQLVGADTVNDEITAHKSGAAHIAGRWTGKPVDTIFEIGGQDSKFIRIEDGVVVDFAMNEACAAGTGSFLEEQAERMGISIERQFSEMALSSTSPVRLGERCTVFMERDVISYLRRGVDKGDIVAGLAYSIAVNYLNRVVRGRNIGECIYFQGGTAYNDSVAAAFAMVLGKEIIVPPHNGVLGAVGAAILARERMAQTGRATRFRGYNLASVDYTLRGFTCKACTNRCEVQEFKVEGEPTYWGDKCSERYRKRARTENRPSIPDLFKEHRELVFEGYDPEFGRGPVVGIPRAMYTYDRFPFWQAFFRTLGVRIALSDETNRKTVRWGDETAIAEPCFPVKVCHGHIVDLVEKGADLLFVPNMINAETDAPELPSHFCPWGQTLPFVIRAAASFDSVRDRFLCPRVRFRGGPAKVKDDLEGIARPLGIRRSLIRRAVDAGYEAMAHYRRRLLALGQEALSTLEQTGAMGIVLTGRAYNVFDRGVNLDLPRKLRDLYGVNVIPMEFLPLSGIDVRRIHPTVYWNYGRKILQAARFVAEHPLLHMIHVTNFKCGPDSFIRHFAGTASGGRPYLTLQFDEHSGDAGILTRCEAYLESKGFLRVPAAAGREQDKVTVAGDGSSPPDAGAPERKAG